MNAALGAAVARIRGIAPGMDERSGAYSLYPNAGRPALNNEGLTERRIAQTGGSR